MKYADHKGVQIGDLEPAEIGHLVLGATLYLRDPRRTPVTVVAHDPATASFTVEVADFEDAGARWVLPLWDVAKFSVRLGAEKLGAAECAALSVQVKALNRNINLDCDADRLAQSRVRISSLQQGIASTLAAKFPNLPVDAAVLLAGSEPSDKWCAALEYVMESNGLLQIEQAFMTQFASNPHAGEMVKGHRIVLAELGLCPYAGQPVRDPAIFTGEWDKTQRAAHILTRLAFMQVMLDTLQMTDVPLYRTVYSDDAIEPLRNTGFVSATFSREVADTLLQYGQKTRNAALYWQKAAAERMFASFVETRALSHRYKEAEALLLFDPGAAPF